MFKNDLKHNPNIYIYIICCELPIILFYKGKGTLPNGW